jgi:ankyrin repeat protein
VSHDKIFRYEPDREIFWVHKQHIAQDFQNICDGEDEPDTVKGSAAWQMALCYLTGFGVATDEQKADEYIARAICLGNDIARQLGPLILHSGTGHTGEAYTEILSSMIIQHAAASENDSLPSHSPSAIVATEPSLEEAIRGKDCERILEIHDTLSLPLHHSSEPLVIQGLRTRNRKVVETLLACKLSPEEEDKSGRNCFHWLFLLGEDALPLAKDCLQRFRCSKALNIPAVKPINVHPQWPLQLRGTPLAHAIAMGCLSTVRALLSLEAHPLAPDEAPRSFKASSVLTWNSIHQAVQYHRSDMLRVLLPAINSGEAEVPVQSHVRLSPLALSYSSVVERMAMHGQNHAKDLDDTIALLGPPSNLEARASDGTTAIMESLDRIDFRVTSAMLKRNNFIGSIPAYSDTAAATAAFHHPIHHAAYLTARRDDPDVLELLKLITENDPEALSRLDSYRRTPLHFAVTGPYPQAVKFLHIHAPSLLHAKDEHGARPLHFCESAPVAEQLLTLGADINAVDDAGRTALFNAVLKGLGPVVGKLCNLGAKTDTGAGQLYNPLHTAVHNSHHELATMLIGFGASANVQDTYGNTALHLAAKMSPRHTLRLLLNNGADAGILNSRGHFPLHTAAESRNIAAIKELSLHNPNLIHTTHSKETHPSWSPLFICAQTNFNAAIEHMLPLLDQGKIEATDCNGHNILHHAADLGSFSLVSGLVRRVANVDLKDVHGNTALVFALRNSRRERTRSFKICQLLIDHGASTWPLFKQM